MISAEENARSILGLPDELLMKIFSHVTFIPTKMSLEQVSKRINSLSADAQSWQGNHKIEIMLISCDGQHMCNMCHRGLSDHVDNEEIRNHKKENISLLNGISVPFVKWPAALQLLLDRTVITELNIHIGNDVDVLANSPTIIPDLIAVFEQNQSKMNIKSLEFHLCSHYQNVANSDQYIGSILIKSLQISTLYLEDFVLDVRLGISLAKSFRDSTFTDRIDMLPFLDQCNSLKAVKFSIYCNVPIHLSVLIGKPLTKVEIVDLRYFSLFINLRFSDLSNVINSATGSGVQTLDLRQFGDSMFPLQVDCVSFKEFCDGLTRNSREKLKVLTIGFWGKLEHVHLIPSIFPNLEKMEIGFKGSPRRIDKLCTVAINLLTHAHTVSPNCKMIIRLDVIKLIDEEFKKKLFKVCQEAGIDVQLGGSIAEVVISKGNTIITIISDYDEDCDSDSSDYDEDEDDDEDDDSD